MSYDYTKERGFVFTESGIEMLLKTRDTAHKLLAEAGAFREQEAHRGLSGDSWAMLACIDYLVERGEIRRVYDAGARQHNIYTFNSEQASLGAGRTAMGRAVQREQPIAVKPKTDAAPPTTRVSFGDEKAHFVASESEKKPRWEP